MFSDRLINLEDQNTLKQIIVDIVELNLKRTYSELVEVEPLIMTTFVPCIYPDGDTSKRPLTDIYCEVVDRDLLKKCCEDQLNEFNSFFPHNRM